MTEFVSLPYSPWSEKARWALDYCKAEYTERTYKPLIGEPALRLRLRKWSGPIGVPALFASDTSLGDSYDIARWADENGPGDLFPENHAKEIELYNVLSERALAAGRKLALARMVTDDEAVAEMVPRGLRKLLGKRAVTVGRQGVVRTARKWGEGDKDFTTARRLFTNVLKQLRKDLAKQGEGDVAGEPRTLLGDFTYADIAMAQVLNFVSPPASPATPGRASVPPRGIRIGHASRRSFTDPELTDEYADLTAWRDLLYKKYR
jgi:glutathione S-transferase